MPARLLAAVATVALVAGCTSGGGSAAPKPSASASSSATTSAYGGTLPLRVAIPRIEAFVQTERGLRFKHAVKVTLLSDKKFVAKLRATQGKDDAAQVEKTKATLAALGLIPASTDLAAAFHSALDAGTIGFYDDKSKQLYVRGAKATPGVQAVLAHELTHALTDQWFRLNRPAVQKDTQEKDLAFTTLIEGDAERTRMDFEAKLSASDRAAAQQQENAGGVPKVPQVVLELIGFPYIAGPDFVTALLLHGGIKALDDAYRHPPVSSEQLLDPEAFFAGDRPRHVPAPPADGHRTATSDLGAVGFLLMLAARLPVATARAAVTGWGGDQFVAWRVATHSWCLRDTVVMDGAAAQQRLDDALRQWVAARPGKAVIEHTGATTTFRSCS